MGSHENGGAGSGGVRIHLLGTFTLTKDDRPVVVPAGSQRAAAYVCLQDRPVARGQVAATLWLDKPGERASANLRSALWRLNRAGTSVLSGTSTHLEVSPEIDVDVRDIAQWADRLEEGTLLEGDLDRPLPHGELLEDWYDDWVVSERERLRQRMLHALENLSRRLAACGRFGRSIEAAITAVAAEPLRESAHRAVISAHLAEGNHSEALRQHEVYRKLLADELGLAPSPRMDALIAGSRAGLAQAV